MKKGRHYTYAYMIWNLPSDNRGEIANTLSKGILGPTNDDEGLLINT